MNSHPRKLPHAGKKRSIFKSVLLAVYFLAIAAILVGYVRLLMGNQDLNSRLIELTAEKNRLERMEVETEEGRKSLWKQGRLRESAQVRTNRALEMSPFERLDLANIPFFVASHRTVNKGKRMEVIINVPLGDQHLKVAFPTQADLQRTPVKREGYWNRSALHFQCSKELFLESGNCYEISYGLIEEGESAFIAAKVRTKEEVLFSQKFPYTLKDKRIRIYGAGTRNTVFLPGEVLSPSIFNMAGVQRPTSWEWGLFESPIADLQSSQAHHLRFTYEGEPPAFLSPPMIERFENTRRFYKWQPLPLSEVFQESDNPEKFVFKAFPKSKKGRSSTPLY